MVGINSGMVLFTKTLCVGSYSGNCLAYNRCHFLIFDCGQLGKWHEIGGLTIIDSDKSTIIAKQTTQLQISYRVPSTGTEDIIDLKIIIYKN